MSTTTNANSGPVHLNQDFSRSQVFAEDNDIISLTDKLTNHKPLFTCDL